MSAIYILSFPGLTASHVNALAHLDLLPDTASVSNMGKKDKNQEPVANLNGVANRDIIQRINFLYQASTYLHSISPEAPSQPPEPSSSKPPPAPVNKKGNPDRKKWKNRTPTSAADLSRAYVHSMRIVGQKAMVRMCATVSLVGAL